MIELTLSLYMVNTKHEGFKFMEQFDEMLDVA